MMVSLAAFSSDSHKEMNHYLHSRSVSYLAPHFGAEPLSNIHLPSIFSRVMLLMAPFQV